MRLGESILLALGSLRTGKMRSMLTLLGIIIGIASVITIMTLGAALKAQTFGSLDSMGFNDLTAQVQNREAAKDADTDYLYNNEPIEDPEALIAQRHVEALKQHFPEVITGISATGASSGRGEIEVVGTQQRSLADKDVKATVTPVNADFMNGPSVKIAHGRSLTEQDVAEERHVAVISPKVFAELYDGDAARALGSELRFTSDTGDLSVLVVGVSEDPKGGLLMGNTSEANIYVPYSLQTVFKYPGSGVLLPDAYESVTIRVAAGQDKNRFKEELQAYFDRYYENNEKYQAKVSDNKKELNSLQKVLDTISIAVAAIGGISLLVGGIGVMNVMLITVTERTREIGIRKALGARSRDIKTQFVVEAMIVCLVGGLIGVVLGGAVGMLGSHLMGTFVFPPLGVVLLSLTFSMAIGLFFGYYPAAKAAKMNPIEALRYE
ncbi:ABC transporter permease [Staphylococcus chromogenes]|nr:ABC transporter permease [Staphylococcus chromogenes]